MMTVGSCFAGIGGFDLGLERAGMTLKWQIENDDFCARVLENRWPDVPRKGDIEQIKDPQSELGYADVVCGGFPCQDTSRAGKRAGIRGERSRQWFNFARIIRSLLPRYAVLENVGGLTDEGLEQILRDLAEVGLDAEWDCLPASAFGAAHPRERIFVIAYPARNGLEGRVLDSIKVQEPAAPLDTSRDWPALSEPLGIRSLNGVPEGVDRIRALGNAVVPQVVEAIGKAILEAERHTSKSWKYATQPPL